MNNTQPHYQYYGGWYAPPGYQPPQANGYMPPTAPYVAPPGALAVQSPSSSLTGSNFVKGAVIGAIAAYLLTNETAQQTVIKAAVKSWSMVQGGVEEMKERFRDAEAELHAADIEE